METHYDVLSIKEDAGEEVIKGAYSALAKMWHPDKHLDNPEFAYRRFLRLVEAYEVLTDKVKRTQYDVYLASHQSSSHQPQPPGINSSTASKTSPPQRFIAMSVGQAAARAGDTRKSCPYLNELADSWQAGFDSESETLNKVNEQASFSSYIQTHEPSLQQRAEQESTDPEILPSSTKPTPILQRLLKGQIPLGQTFWLYGVLGVNLVYLPIRFIGPENRVLLALAALVVLAYQILIYVSIWRSAKRSGPWGYVARFFCILPFVGILATFILPSFKKVVTPVAAVSSQTDNTSKVNDEMAAEWRNAQILYPIFNSTNGVFSRESNDAIQEVIALANSYTAKGYSNAESIRMATDIVGGRRGGSN